MQDVDRKRKEEQRIVNCMIEIYCKKKHNNEEICENCRELMEYSNKRIDKCPHMATKTFCSACTTQCYDKKHKAAIREVMRFSGPWMIFYHPIALIRHMFLTRKNT